MAGRKRPILTALSDIFGRNRVPSTESTSAPVASPVEGAGGPDDPSCGAVMRLSTIYEWEPAQCAALTDWVTDAISTPFP